MIQKNITQNKADMLPRVSNVKCQDADYMLFSTADVISNTLFATGKWEDHLFQISKFILSGIDAPLVLDIGANLGAYSIPLAKEISKVGGNVIGFEPQRIVYYQLCGNVFLNRLDNYYAINSGVGSTDCMIEIPEIDYENNVNIGAFSLEKKYREIHGIENSIKNITNKVPLITLDNFEVEKPPALIKIDVEGLELSVLKGGRNFLNSNLYPPLLFEAWGFDWFKEGRDELMAFILEMGYDISSFNTTDYIAQHPKNPVLIEFSTNNKGVISMIKIK